MNNVRHIQTISEMMHLLGVDDIRHPLVEIIDMETAVNPQKFNGSAASLGFYMVVYKESGCSPLTYGLSKYDYDNGTLLFFSPDQEFGIVNVGSPRGKMLMFSPDLLSHTLLGTMMHRYSFFSYSVNEGVHISEREKQQLLASDDTISEVAYNLGFEYPQYFTRLFKKMTGQTPNQYRAVG